MPTSVYYSEVRNEQKMGVRVQKPNYWDFHLSQKKIQELEHAYRSLKKQRKAIQTAFQIGGIGLAMVPVLPTSVGKLPFYALGIVAIGCAMAGAGIGYMAGNWFYKFFKLRKLTHSPDFKNYQAYRGELYKYESWLREENLKYWKNLNDYSFQQELADLLKKLKFNVSPVLEENLREFKLRIGNDTLLALRLNTDMMSDTELEKIHIAFKFAHTKNLIVVNRGSFSGKCRKLARKYNIRLWDMNHILKMAKEADKS